MSAGGGSAATVGSVGDTTASTASGDGGFAATGAGSGGGGSGGGGSSPRSVGDESTCAGDGSAARSSVFACVGMTVRAVSTKAKIDATATIRRTRSATAATSYVSRRCGHCLDAAARRCLVEALGVDRRDMLGKSAPSTRPLGCLPRRIRGDREPGLSGCAEVSVLPAKCNLAIAYSHAGSEFHATVEPIQVAGLPGFGTCISRRATRSSLAR
jgi:hypothetical protein